MKKSKVIIPALGVLILSTAASVTGTVAWFTANRTATITAGEFAVVKTNDDLRVTLGAGAGTQVSSATAIGTKTNYKLTDSSFDHTSYNGASTHNKTDAAAVLPIVTPNIPRSHVLDNIPLASAHADESLLARGSNTYSAFTWTMQFTVSFSESANKKLGLFIDLGDPNTYMREVCHPSDHTNNKAEGVWYTDLALSTPATPSAENYYQYTAVGGEDGEGWYTNQACSSDAPATLVAGTPYYQPGLPSGTYYRIPDATGKAFRIAFVPTAVSGASTACYGLTKIWADNASEADEKNHVKAVSAGSGNANQLNAVAYGNDTTAYDGSAFTSDSASSGVLMTSETTRIPDDGTASTTTSKSTYKNYMGYFAPNPGHDVSITYTCVAWYDGTHPEIVGSATDFEIITVSMKFGVSELTD